MTIQDKHAFEDAQSLARLAVYGSNVLAPESLWWAAMQALKAAYKGEK